MKRRRTKKADAPQAGLPADYGRTGLTLLDVDPFHLHAAWELAPRARAAAEKKCAGAAGWMLRFHDEREGSTFDFPVEPDARSWYVELWAADKTYHAELGPCSGPDDFVAVCRSNTITTPPAAAAPHQEPQWLAVNGALETARLVSAPPVERAENQGRMPAAGSPAPEFRTGIEPALTAPADTTPTDFPLAEPPQAGVITPVEAVEELALPAAIAAVLEEKTPDNAGPPASSDSVGSFSMGGRAGKAAIELELNAEVIVYGRAQPGQTLRVNGQPMAVNEDGTFHVRWALPVAKP